MSRLGDVLVRPLTSEKSSALKMNQSQVCFEVHIDADKTSIKKAVEKFFNVKVTGVRTAVVHGKIKRVGRYSGRQSNWKKAIVTLKEGHDIQFFDESEE